MNTVSTILSLICIILNLVVIVLLLASREKKSMERTARECHN